MRVTGSAQLGAPPAQVLAVLRDPRRFVAALPNVDELEFEPVEDGSFRAKIRPAIALGEVPIETLWRRRPADAGQAGGDADAGASPAESTASVPGAGEHLVYAMEGGTGEHRVELEATVTLRERAGDANRPGESERSGDATVAGVGTEAAWTVSFEVTGTMRSAGQRTIAAIVAAQAEAVLEAAASQASAP